MVGLKSHESKAARSEGVLHVGDVAGDEMAVAAAADVDYKSQAESGVLFALVQDFLHGHNRYIAPGM